MRVQRRPPAGLVERTGWAAQIVARRNHRAQLSPGRVRGWPRSQVGLPPDPFAAEAPPGPRAVVGPRTAELPGLPGPEGSPLEGHPIRTPHGEDASPAGEPATNPAGNQAADRSTLPVWERLAAAVEVPAIDVRTFVVGEGGRIAGEPHQPSSSRTSEGPGTSTPRPDPGKGPPAPRRHAPTVERHDPVRTAPDHDAAASIVPDRTAPPPVVPGRTAPAPVVPGPARWSAPAGAAAGTVRPAGEATTSAANPDEARHRPRHDAPTGTTEGPARQPDLRTETPDPVEMGRLADAVAERLRDREAFDRTRRGAVPWQR